MCRKIENEIVFYPQGHTHVGVEKIDVVVSRTIIKWPKGAINYPKKYLTLCRRERKIHGQDDQISGEGARVSIWSTLRG